MKFKLSERLNVFDSIVDAVKRIMSKKRGSPISMDLKSDGYVFCGKNGRVEFTIQDSYLGKRKSEYGGYVICHFDKIEFHKFDLVLYPNKNNLNFLRDSQKFLGQPIINFLVEKLSQLNS